MSETLSAPLVPAEKVDAWMPLWIGSYLADTMRLTTKQHGAYLLLLFAYWRNRGPIEDDDDDLASTVKATPKEWRTELRPKIERFFDIVDGHWAHGRADRELAKAGQLKQAKTNRAKAGAAARWEKERTARAGCEHAPSNARALPKECPTPSPSSIPSVQKKERATPSIIQPSALIEAGFTPEQAADFIAHKAAHKAPLTERAWVDHLQESAKARWTPVQAAEKVMAKGWKGFEAKYVEPRAPPSRQAESPHHRAQRERIASLVPGVTAPSPRPEFEHESTTTPLAIRVR
jgi:uncharacterized protein YdaU (DUF1376 family)